MHCQALKTLHLLGLVLSPKVTHATTGSRQSPCICSVLQVPKWLQNTYCWHVGSLPHATVKKQKSASGLLTAGHCWLEVQSPRPDSGCSCQLHYNCSPQEKPGWAGWELEDSPLHKNYLAAYGGTKRTTKRSTAAHASVLPV